MITSVFRLTSGRVAVALLAFIAFLALFGKLIAPHDAIKPSGPQLAGPSGSHWLGTDYLGRDVLSRILDGSALSVGSAVMVAGIALVFGALPGILSVYLGPVVEWLSLRVVDTLIALPFLVFAVALTTLLGNGVLQAMFAVGILVAPIFYRVSRSATLSVANSQYVEAAILAGASTGWIVRKHVWAKILPPVAIAVAHTVATGLTVIASLTFLNIGVKPPTPTWGGILASDLGYLGSQPWAPVYPIVLILISVLACNMLADAIRDAAGQSGRALLNARSAKKDRSERGTPPRVEI